MRSILRYLPLAIAVLLLACAAPSRYGMVKDPESGLQFGSVVEDSFVTDASFYENRKIKVRIRNTSGDGTFDLRGFRGQIERSYAATGYQPTQGDDFGLLVDINVMYSGQIQRNLAAEFGFLGATAGGLAGASTGEAIPAIGGTVAGATLAAIIGSHVADDTYIIVTRVAIGIVRGGPKTDGKRISFSRSTFQTDEEKEKEESKRRRGFRSVHQTRVAAFAGGRNVTQAEIASRVRERIASIIRDII